MKAVCHRCGGPKNGSLVACQTCGVTPTAADRSLAWLLSYHHLNEAELELVGERIRQGDRPDPSRSLLEEARIAMGAKPMATQNTQPLQSSSLLLLAVVELVLTPLAGFAVWFGLRQDRPIAARQVLRVTIPITIALAGLWAVFVFANRNFLSRFF